MHLFTRRARRIIANRSMTFPVVVRYVNPSSGASDASLRLSTEAKRAFRGIGQRLPDERAQLTLLCQTTTAGKPGLTSRAKAMSSPLIVSSPVEPDTPRGVCPARRRLVEVIRSRYRWPCMPVSVSASNLDVRSDTRDVGTWAMRTDLDPVQAVIVQSRWEISISNPVQGVRAFDREGAFNLGWRGEFSAWQQAKPDLTGPAIGRKSPDDEELNRERPVRACQ